MRRYLTNLFTLKAADYGNRGMPALEVSELFFVPGYISACGDALYRATIFNDRLCCDAELLALTMSLGCRVELSHLLQYRTALTIGWLHSSQG
jgi:hypothetical protein